MNKEKEEGCKIISSVSEVLYVKYLELLDIALGEFEAENLDFSLVQAGIISFATRCFALSLSSLEDPSLRESILERSKEAILYLTNDFCEKRRLIDSMQKTLG